MSDKHHIDRLFKGKLRSFQMKYDETAWERMEQLLEKKKKKKIIYWFFGVFTFLTFVLIGWNIYNSGDAKKLPVRETEQTILEQDVVQQDFTTEKVAEKNQQSVQDVVPHTVQEEVSEEEHVEENHFENQAWIAAGAPKPSPSMLLPHKSNRKKQELKASSSLPKNESYRSFKIPKKYYVSTQKNSKLSQMMFLPAYKIYLSEEYGKKQLKKYKAMLRKEKRAQRIPLRDRLNFLRKTSLGVITAVSAYEGLLNTGTSKDKVSITPNAGFRISYLVDNMTSIDVNVIYAYRSGLNSEYYQTDKSGLMTTIKTLQVHYLDIPLLVNYRINRNGLLIGLKYSRLLTIKKEINTSKVDENYQIVKQSKVNYQNNEGFSTMDLGITFGYQYLITEKLNVGIRINYGLFDITDNTKYNNAADDRNKSVQITLDYSLFKY